MCSPIQPIRFRSVDDADLRLVRAKLDLCKSTINPPRFEVSKDLPVQWQQKVSNSLTWAWVEGWQTAWSVVESYLRGEVPKT